MNADLLAPGSNVFYLRGTSGACQNCGPLIFPRVAISYERSGHTQLNRDCPVEWLSFPVVHTDSPASDHGLSPPPTADVRSAALAANIQECAETLDIYSQGNTPSKSPFCHYRVLL